MNETAATDREDPKSEVWKMPVVQLTALNDLVGFHPFYLLEIRKPIERRARCQRQTLVAHLCALTDGYMQQRRNTRSTERISR